MAIHFTKAEFTERQHKTIEQLKSRQLDGLLMFRQESMYYLSGYDSFGYVFFRPVTHPFLKISASGRTVPQPIRPFSFDRFWMNLAAGASVWELNTMPMA